MGKTPYDGLSGEELDVAIEDYYNTDYYKSKEAFSTLDVTPLMLVSDISKPYHNNSLSVEQLKGDTQTLCSNHVPVKVEKKKKKRKYSELEKPQIQQHEQEECVYNKSKKENILLNLSDTHNEEQKKLFNNLLTEDQELAIYRKEQEYKLKDVEFQVLTTSNLLARNIYDDSDCLSDKLCTAKQQLVLAKKKLRQKYKHILTEEKKYHIEQQCDLAIYTLKSYGVNITNKMKFALYKSYFNAMYKSYFNEYVEKHTTQEGINKLNAALLEFINHCDKQIFIRKKNNQLISKTDNHQMYGASMYDFGSAKVYKEILLVKDTREKYPRNYASIRYFVLKSDNKCDNDMAEEYLKMETSRIRICGDKLGYKVKPFNNYSKQNVSKRYHSLSLNRRLKRKYPEYDTD